MYAKYFGLKGNPFALSPNPKFFFNSKTHRRALSCLGYGLGQGQGFVVITGAPGTGKSMLMSSLVKMLQQSRIMLPQIVNSNLQHNEMLRYLAAELGLQYENQSRIELLKSIENCIEKCRVQNQRIIVLIDEAQNITDSAIEELMALINLVQPDEALFQCVLFGQTSLKQSLYTHAFQPLRERVITSYHMHALAEEETKDYIILRLRTVGWSGNPVFSPGAFVAIHDYSLGIPARINLICGRALQAACINERQEISEEDILNVVRELDHHFGESNIEGYLEERVVGHLIKAQSNKKTKQARGSFEAVSHVTKRPVDITDACSVNPETEAIPIVTEQVTSDALMNQPVEELDDELRQWLRLQKQNIRQTKSVRELYDHEKTNLEKTLEER